MALDPSTTPVRSLMLRSEFTGSSRVPHDPIAGVTIETDCPPATLSEADHAALTHSFATFAVPVMVWRRASLRELMRSVRSLVRYAPAAGNGSAPAVCARANWRDLRVVVLPVVLLIAAACGGREPTAPPEVVPPREALPELRSLTIAFSDDAPPASRSTLASVAAIDHRGQPMTVGSIGWSSSDTAIATISTDGTILARRVGTTTIAAAVGLVTSRRPLTVLSPPPGPLPVVSVTVSPLSVTLAVGASQQLTAVLRDFAGTVLADRDVAWASSNDSVAVVSATGVVTARGRGVAVIEAISEGKRSGAVITVKAAVDPNISVFIAAPLSGAAFADSVRMLVSVRSVLPLDSVIVVIAGRSTPLRLVLTPNIAGTIEIPTWEANADISSAPYGTLAVVVTATDILGRQAVAVTSVVRNPGLTPGSKAPPASK